MSSGFRMHFYALPEICNSTSGLVWTHPLQEHCFIAFSCCFYQLRHR